MRPHLRATLAPPAGALSLWLTTVGPDQLPCAVWAMPDQRIGFTAHHADGSVARLTVTDSPGLTSLDHLQPLPGGRWVMIDSRSEFSTTSGVVRNAVLVSAEGEHLAQECVGDAVDHAVATAEGSLWLGYWDEATTGETPAQLVGSAGLVRWSPDLSQAWVYEGEATAILTCDALTVDGERAVASIDGVRAADAADSDEARLIVVDGDRGVDLAGGVAQAWGVLADGDLVALLGSPDDDLLVTVGRLGDGRLETLGTTRLETDPDALTARACRGGTLHLFQGDRWATLTLAELRDEAVGSPG